MYVYFIQEQRALLAPLDKRQDTRRWLLAFFRKCRRLLPRTCCTGKSWYSQTWLKLDWKRVPIIDRRASLYCDISCNYMHLNLPGNVELSCLSRSDDVFLDNQSNLIIILFIAFWLTYRIHSTDIKFPINLLKNSLISFVLHAQQYPSSLYVGMLRSNLVNRGEY